MNCKITAAATLPFMACWSLLQRVRGAALVEAANESVVASEGSGAPSTRLSLVVVCFDCSMDTLLHVVALSGGAALGHGPWVYLYWVSGSVRKWAPVGSVIEWLSVLASERVGG